MRRPSVSLVALLARGAFVLAIASCADPDFVPPKRGGAKPGSAGSAGAAGGIGGRAGNGAGGSSAGAGAAGASAGAAGIAGSGGASGGAGLGGGGTGASSGSAGAAAMAGSAGISGAAGTGGKAGSTGLAGAAGNATAGASGAAGASAGQGGTSGTSGTGGATAGQGGSVSAGTGGTAGGAGKAGGAGQAGQSSGGSAGSSSCIATSEVCDGKDNDCDGTADEAILMLDQKGKEHPRGACVRFGASTDAAGFPLTFARTEGDADLGAEPRELYYSLVFGLDGTGPFVDATIAIRETSKDFTVLVGTARVLLGGGGGGGGGGAKAKAILAQNVNGAVSFGAAKNLKLLGTHAAADNETHDFMIPIENTFDGASYTSINPIVLRVVGQIAPNANAGNEATRIIVPGKSVGIELSL